MCVILFVGRVVYNGSERGREWALDGVLGVGMLKGAVDVGPFSQKGSCLSLQSTFGLFIVVIDSIKIGFAHPPVLFK